MHQCFGGRAWADSQYQGISRAVRDVSLLWAAPIGELGDSVFNGRCCAVFQTVFGRPDKKVLVLAVASSVEAYRIKGEFGEKVEE